jgi:PAS domain S-box-containing protein
MIHEFESRNMSLKNKLTFGFGAALCILAMIGLLSYRRFSQENVDQQWVEHSHQVLEMLDSTLASLLELSAEERGFALTHSSPHLQSSRHLKDVIESNLRQIKTLTADNPRQQATYSRLADLVGARVALIEELKTQSSSEENLETPRNELSGQIRTLLMEMRLQEEKLLGERLQEAAAGNRQMKAILDVGYAFSLLLFGLTVYAIFREIEKRKESEESLRRAQEQYRLLFDSNPIPVWVYDLETLDILDVNATASNRYGYTREEFLRLKISDLRPQPDVPTLLKNIRETTQAVQDSGPWRHEKKSGEIIDVQIRSYPLNFGGKDARLAVATDITDQKKAEDALKESEERFRLIVSNIKDYAIIVLNPGGQITSWNGGAQRIKGYKADEIVGQHFSIFYPPEDISVGKPTIELNSAREEGRFEDDSWRVRKDGSRFWANVVVTPLRDDVGTLRGFVKITRDVTEKRKAEQEIVRRSLELEATNKELEAFSYSVSHDLRAPLRAIEGFSQALHEDYHQQLDDTAKDYLRRIRSATHRMAELIDDLLNLSRVTRAEMHKERIDLSKLASEVAQELNCREPKRAISLKIAEGLQAEGDSRLIRVALQNLIGNAWKFTSKRPQAEIEFGQQFSNGDRTYFVRDNGAGFDQSYASRLFGAFQRLHAANEFPGTGIGLATVQRIIHRHGGSVWAEGIVNRGATIYFTLGRQNS